MELAGIKTKYKIDGLSLIPLLLNKGKQQQHKYLYWEFHENNGRQAVRWGKWKGIRLNVSKDENAPIELYDLSTDPSEQKNVAAKNPLIVQKINLMMKEAHVFNKDWPLLKSERVE